jgi:hypothetical protein
MSAIYRVQQFVRAAAAWIQSPGEEWDLAERCLPPAGWNLFQAMPPYDQQHGLRVARTLREEGHTDPDLLAAALLHDAGKTAGQQGALTLGHRVATVLLRAFCPAVLAKLGREAAPGWGQGFYVQTHHAAIGAELARRADCSSRTVDLILHHENRSSGLDDPLLAVLQAADDRN